MTLGELALWANRRTRGAESRKRLSQFLANFQHLPLR